MDQSSQTELNKRRRYTIRDVASAANLAVSTVSKALNGRPDVSEETRLRVKRIADELGFTQNTFAQNLINGRSNLVAIVADELDSEYHNQILRGIARAAQNRHLEVLLTFTPRAGAALTTCMQVRQRGIADSAVVISPKARDEEGLRDLHGTGFSSVIVNPTLRLPELASVESTWAAGSYTATRHLLDLGHRKIALIAGELEYAFGRERVEGYKAALQDFGLYENPRLVAVGTPCDEMLGHHAVSHWLDHGEPFTAVVCFNDLVAYGVMRELTARGIVVPQQVSVVGFDDLPASRYVVPGLTTVRQPSEDIGLRAMQLVADQLDGVNRAARHVQMPTTLMVRSSTAPPPDY